MSPSLFNIFNLCVARASDNHWLLLIVIPEVLSNSIGSLIPVKYGHTAVHKDETVFIKLALPRFFDSLICFQAIRGLIDNQIDKFFRVSCINYHFETHQIVWLVIHNKDSFRFNIQFCLLLVILDPGNACSKILYVSERHLTI